MTQRRSRQGYREPGRRQISAEMRNGRPIRDARQRSAPRRQDRRQPPRRTMQPRWGLRLLAAALIWAAAWFGLTHYAFIIRNVEVTGAQSMSNDAVLRASGIRLGTRLSALDDAAVRANVDATGSLAFVSLEKRYPVTVRLNVRERSRDAMILHAGKMLILDSDGCVVSAGESAPADTVPYVTGLNPTSYRLGAQLDVAPGKLTALRSVLEALKARDAMAYASELDLENPADLTIITRTGMTVALGDADNMENKIAWMAGALRDLESRGETLGRLDVSSGTKADYLPMIVATPTPAPTQNLYLLETPAPAATLTPVPQEGAVIGENAI